MKIDLQPAALMTAAMIVGGLSLGANAQTASILAGQGSSDASGVPATTARMLGVSTNVTAPDGTIYFTEQSGRVRKITLDGKVWTIAGRDYADCGFSGDGGQATAARLCYPAGIALDVAGDLYVADSGNNRIRKISSATGVITTIAGSGNTVFYQGGFSGDGGPATSAQFAWPSWMVFDAGGNLYVTDEGNNRVRKITPAGIVSTAVGSGPAERSWTEPSFSGDGGQATAARLLLPQGLAIDGAGNLYVVDRGNHRIRRVAVNGIISTIVGSGPDGWDNGGFEGDGGSALLARLNHPQGLAIDKAGNLYVADWANARVRKIDGEGTITTVAGNGTGLNPPVEGADATSFSIRPWSVSTDPGGNILIDTDQSPPLIVKVALFTSCADQGPAGAQLKMCEAACEATDAPPAGLIRAYEKRYGELPGCAY